MCAEISPSDRIAGANIYNFPLFLFLHIGEHFPDHIKCAVQVKSDIMIPALVCDGKEITGRLSSSGIIDQNINGAEFLRSLCHQIPDVPDLTHITVAVIGNPSLCYDLIPDLYAIFVIDIRHHNLCAIGGQPCRHPAAYASA